MSKLPSDHHPESPTAHDALADRLGEQFNHPHVDADLKAALAAFMNREILPTARRLQDETAE